MATQYVMPPSYRAGRASPSVGGVRDILSFLDYLTRQQQEEQAVSIEDARYYNRSDRSYNIHISSNVYWISICNIHSMDNTIGRSIMLITKVSMLSGVTHTRDIDVTQEQLEAWAGGVFVQNAMPHLSVDDREFIKTGSTPEEWEDLFNES